MQIGERPILLVASFFSVFILISNGSLFANAQSSGAAQDSAPSRIASNASSVPPASPEYQQIQKRLAHGWNTWDVHSVTTHVQLPDGLAIHIGLKHNSTLNGDAFLEDALIGRLDPGAEVVTPGPHSWDGSYTDLRVAWKDHVFRVQSAHDGDDLALLVTPLPSPAASALPSTIVFSVNFLWNRAGTSLRRPDFIETRGASGSIPIYCTCAATSATPAKPYIDIPLGSPFFAADLTGPVGLITGKRRTLLEIDAIIANQERAYRQSVAAAEVNAPIVDAIETTLGWDTIFEPEKGRVVSPVSRVWSVGWGGYVIFDWDTFFAASMAGIGDKDLAYADAIETLRESTAQGFVPNYGRAGNWKSSDRSEPPVGAITVLGLYRRFHDRWFIQDAFAPLLRWNRWWAEHRDTQGYLTWGSDPGNQPANLDDKSRGTWQGAIFESGLDNSPMYDGSTYNTETHLLEYADVGLMSMYIADCDALSEIATALDKPTEAKELRDRAIRYRAKLATMWDENAGIFLNRDLRKGKSSERLSPTNFYPLMAHAATPAQAQAMITRHLLNPDEFSGEWVIPSIAKNDPAFHDQEYWRGRIWGPMNYLVYLGLLNYDNADVRREFAKKSYRLFLQEWTEKGHVHENYNAITGTGDDVRSSDRFYHWGALLGYIEFLEQNPTHP
jgi:putative isomerase